MALSFYAPLKMRSKSWWRRYEERWAKFISLLTRKRCYYLGPRCFCPGSCTARETCSRAWRGNRRSAPGLRLTAAIQPGKSGNESSRWEKKALRSSWVRSEIIARDRHARIESKPDQVYLFVIVFIFLFLGWRWGGDYRVNVD